MTLSNWIYLNGIISLYQILDSLTSANTFLFVLIRHICLIYLKHRVMGMRQGERSKQKEKERNAERKRSSIHHWFPLQKDTVARARPGQGLEPGTTSVSVTRPIRVHILGSSPVAFQMLQQGAGSKAEQPELKQVLTWDATVADDALFRVSQLAWMLLLGSAKDRKEAGTA